MARHVRSTIRYDGPALAGHAMDVQDLAPALLALADIVQIANRKFNAGSADIRVLVDADTEQKCFQLDLSLVQSFIDQAATFLGQKDVATVKEIAEWIGLIGGPSLGLFGLYKRISSGGAKARGVTFRAGDTIGTTIINIEGDSNTVIVSTQTAELARDPEIVRHVRTVVRPLEKDGYEDLAFIHNDQAVTTIDKEEAAAIISAPMVVEGQDEHVTTSEIRGSVRIKSPQYEGNAKWSLLWGGRAISAEMPLAWATDFQSNRISAAPNSVLDVSMTENVRLDAAGLALSAPTYVVGTVHAVTPPPIQMSLI